jgi:threonine/homoserine/homoserine lactone efflux protein
MPDGSTLLLFAGAAIVLVVVPGPNLIYIVARSVGEGRAAGLASAFGVETGTLVHVAAAAAGVSALLASSATAFSVVKYAGAAYLVYLGVRALLARGEDGEVAPAQPAPLQKTFRQGMVVQLLNPKVALFFLAFLPQFVDPAGGPVALQILVLGAILTAIGLTVDVIYALAAGAAGARLRGRPGATRVQERASGVIYLVLGAAAAFSGGRRG